METSRKTAGGTGSKTAGIIGGIGPESTIEYYRLIIASYLERRTGGDYPQILINSINMQKMLDMLAEDRLDEMVDFVVSEIRKLAGAGADFALLASNTPHIVFDQINEVSPLPLISIVEATCQRTLHRGMRRVGLFGTKFTMQGDFYHEFFAGHGVTVISPEISDQDYIHDKYMGELVKGVIRDETRNELLKIADKLKSTHQLHGLILGGTELSLILRDGDAEGLPFLDTTRIHVECVIEKLL